MLLPMPGGEAKPIYVLHGEDAFLLDSRRREIAEQVAGGADPQLCLTVFEADAALADVFDELRTVPFLAPRRLVVVRDADAFVSANRQKLEELLESPPASASLMLIVRSWPKNTRLAKLVNRIGRAEDCSVPAGNLSAWLAKAAEKRGKKLVGDAAGLLAASVGADLGILDSELEKLSLYVGDRPTITADDVGALVAATAGPERFALTNAITAGDAPAALKALAGMLRVRGDEFMTLGMIAWHLRRCLLAREQVEAGTPLRQAVPRLPPRAAEEFAAMLNRRPARRFRRDFRSLLRADLAMKSGTPPAAALQQLVLELCE